ncbi:haloalkane dehalogenase [Janibacter sp. GS2]|uniref:haloalkane dehalogenase n=1 Tax=Janibacter sp. GS2 TaxID=3442646 RepID=UPI003EBEC313
MDLLRTPESAFDAIADFPHPPRFADVPTPDADESVRMAWYSAGPEDGPVVLLLHGEPTWSYLYRDVMSALADAGMRAIAVDLVGFGRSDKPASVLDHTYERHVAWVRALVFDVLDLRDVTLLGQDWGGLIGLRLVGEHPDRFARVVASNTGLPTGDHDMPPQWWQFRRTVEAAPVLDVGRLVSAGCRRPMRPGAAAAYDAPFPDPALQAGPRAMPSLVPTTPEDPATEANRAAWDRLSSWDRPFLVAFSDSDPITGPMGPVLQKAMTGARGLHHPVLAGAGHFLQEDAGAELGDVVAAFVRGDRDSS